MKDESSITVDFDGHSCPVAFSGWRRCLTIAAGKGQRAVVISNPGVFALHGRALVGNILPKDWEIIPLMMGDGERFKSARTVAAIHNQLLDLDIHRNNLIIAFGGGVVGDTAGFAAAIYKRGIGFIQVPTTLVAMVDAAVGAKVGINHPRGKNLVGTFYQPKGIIINPDWLGTLPEREMNDGVAELVKVGFLVSKTFVQAVLSMPLNYKTADRRKWTALIEGAVLLKAHIVNRDPFDQDLRRILNFGHTFAHAVEKAEGCRRYHHGEAVWAGMAGALYLSHLAGCLSKKRRDEYLGHLVAPVSRLPVLNRPADAYFSVMRYDKKNSGLGPVFVLLETIGRPVLSAAPSAADIRRAIEFMRRFVNSGGRI